MPVFNSTVTLNGSTSFSIPDFGTFSWSNSGFLRTLDIWDGDAEDVHNVTMNLSGSNWTVRDLSTGGNAVHNLTITDQNANGGRFIENINMFDGGSMTMDLQSTGSRAVFLRDGVFDLSLGSGFFGHVQLSNGTANTVGNDPGGLIQALHIGETFSGPADNQIDIAGRLNAGRIFTGNNTVDVSGRIDSLVINEADSSIVTGAAGSRIDSMIINGFYSGTGDLLSRSTNTIDVARIDALRINGGENDITIRDRAQTVTIYDSISDITVAQDARISALTGAGTNTIDLLGNASIFQARLDNGTHSLTSQSGNVGSYISFNSTNTLNIGSGGIQQVRLGNTVDTQTINAAGFVGAVHVSGPGGADMSLLGGAGSVLAYGAAEFSLTLGDGGFNGTAQVYGTTRSTVTTGDGDVVAIFTGDGDDRISTGNGFVAAIDAGDGNDIVTIGSGGAGSVSGGSGDDTLIGGAGDDLLQGGSGTDTFVYNGGNDTISDFVFGSENLTVELGLTRAQIDAALNGAISTGQGAQVDFGGGNSLTFSNATVGQVQSLIDNVGGSEPVAGMDIRGTGLSEVLTGGLGDDTISAAGGNDTVYGEAGDDVINAGFGFDLVFGGTGNDSVLGLNGFDTLNGDDGNDTLIGNAGNDLLFGGNGEDRLDGGIGADTLHGDAGDDLLFGGAGGDQLFGGAGDDRLFGNAGNDRLDGGAGNDVLIGGIGRDTFVFGVGYGADRVADFQNGIDSIEIDAALLVQANPVASDLIQYAGRDADGFLILDFGNGDTLTFTGVTNTGAILDEVVFI